jgi:hypothetical protein
MMKDDDWTKRMGEPFDPHGWILLGEPGKESLFTVKHGEGIAICHIEDHNTLVECRVFALRNGVKVFRTMEEVCSFLEWDGIVRVK